jgi:hypothetical protein
MLYWLHPLPAQHRCWWWLCSMIAVVWLLGLLPTLGYELDPYSVLVPFLVFAIGMSHGAQKMNGIMQDIGRGVPTSWMAARYTFRRLFLAGHDGAAGRRGGLCGAAGDRHPGDPGAGDRRLHRRGRADLHQPDRAAHPAELHRRQRPRPPPAACAPRRTSRRVRLDGHEQAALLGLRWICFTQRQVGPAHGGRGRGAGRWPALP